MTESLSYPLEKARLAATADPERHGGEFALLLADEGLRLMRSGRWDTSLQLLDEAEVFIRRVGGPHTTVRAFKTELSAQQSALREKLSAQAGGLEILRSAVEALPAGHMLAPFAKSRLGHRLLQANPESMRDRAMLEESIRLCAEALQEAPAPDTELLVNLGDALRARFDLANDLADLDDAIGYLTLAAQLTPAGNADLHAVLSYLGDALLARFDATNDVADLAKAIEYLTQAVQIAPGADRPAALCNMGAALRRRYQQHADLADLDEAITCLRAALQSGDDRSHQDTLQSNLGAALLQRYVRTGNPAEQAEALEHLNRAAETVPADAPERPAILSTLAEALCSADRWSAARDLLSEALRRRETVLGPDHPSTLASRHNLAVVMANLGHCRTAAQEFREVLRVRERVLGEDHPETLASRHNLAVALADLDLTEEAEAELSEVVRVRIEVLGPDHPDTRASQGALDRLRRR